MSYSPNNTKRRARFRLPLLSLLGVLLVPLSIAGLLTWSLSQPEDRIKDVKAAVVNTDEPVQLNGQLVPLGRQLTAKLVGGEIKSNYSWELADEKSAAEGLKDGTYIAVVTVPKNFSQAATSFSGDPAKSQRAKIDVSTSDRSHLADDVISRTVTSTAANLLGQQLTTTYLDNIYVGFNTLNKQLGDASHGATSLADGAEQLAGGTGQLSGGAGQLANGSRQLSQGLSALDDGAGQLSTGMGGLSSGLNQLSDKTAQMPQQSKMLADVATQESQGVQQISGELGNLSEGLQRAMKQCPPGTLPVCNEIAVQAFRAKALDEGAGKITQASTGVSQGLNTLAEQTPALAGGIGQLAGGASQLNDGMTQLSGGVSKTSDGASQLADGADQLASGAGALSDGAHKLSDGSGQLSSGLGQAVEKLPTYPDGDRDQLAKTVANPVETSGNAGIGSSGNGASLYAVLALWVGALAMFVAMRAVPSRILESTRSSLVLALRNFSLPAGLAVAQGLLVTVVIGVSQDLSVGGWFGCAALASLAAVSFTAVNQALVAAFNGTGRFVSMLTALVVVANGFIAAVPALLTQVSAALPVGPATNALRAILSGTGSTGGAIALLAIWAVSGLAVTCLAIERQRTVSASRLLAPGSGGQHATLPA